MYRAPAWLSIEQLRQRITDQLAHEPQLLVDPAFFPALKQSLGRISHVQIQLRRGYLQNEMTRFRYDVFLHVEKQNAVLSAIERIDWRKHALTVPVIRQYLAERRPQILAIDFIPNARLLEAAGLVELLAASDDGTSVDDLRTALSRLHGQGVEPEEFWTLLDGVAGNEGEKLPYLCYANACRGNAIDHFDVVYQQLTGTVP